MNKLLNQNKTIYIKKQDILQLFSHESSPEILISNLVEKGELIDLQQE